MTQRELEIQRRGYAAALRSDAVHRAVRSGLLGRIALTYVEWAGSQEIVVDWHLIEDRADLDAFAGLLTSRFDPAFRRTSISGALAFGAELIASNAFSARRQVIDVSGDGPNNSGRPVALARDAVLAQGIVINGLPLMTREGLCSQWQLDGLDIYYRTCVSGGPGSFVIPVLDWDDFEEAVRRKLVLEIAGRARPQGWTATPASARDPRDCMIGEKMWRDRQPLWGDP